MADIDNFDKTSLAALWGNKIKPGLAEKIDKVPSATSGHLAKFGTGGQVVDGGDTADYAKNLVAPVVQSDAEFVFRKTGGSLAVDGAGGAVMQRIKGKTLVWNQILRDEEISFSGTETGGFGDAFSSAIPQDHKVLISVLVKKSSDFSAGTQNISLAYRGDTYGGVLFYSSVPADDTFHKIKGIVNNADSRNENLYYHVSSHTAGTVTFKNQNIVDLTLLFNGNVPDNFTVEDFEAMFPLPYYAYNPGTLISNDASAIETVGFNQWDEEWEAGRYNPSTGERQNNSNCIRSKNFIPVFPSTQYFINHIHGNNNTFIIEYDVNQSFIAFHEGIDRNNITFGANTRYITLFVGNLSNPVTTYLNDICINLPDPARNGQYEPYKKTVTTLNLTGLTGKKDGVGESVVVFQEGLNDALGVDTIEGEKAKKYNLTIDTGTLTFTYNSTYQGFYSNALPNSKASFRAKFVKYPFAGSYSVTGDKQSGFIFYNNLFIKDSSFSQDAAGAAALAQSLSGEILIYEPNEPEEYILDSTPDYTYPVDGNGTERRLPEDTASSVHAPFRADILYALNGSATLRNLDANYVRNDNIKQDIGNNENTVMSQAAVTRELNIVNQRISDIGSVTDLSFIDPKTGAGLFTRNTAKTYVVRTAGSYKFPLVYSNAIRNGKPNPASYTRIVSDYTAEFVNHLGNTITNPYIEQNIGCIPASVSLLWQTATGLITSVSLESGPDCHYLRFTVASVPSDNGLACLVVKDANGDIMWSWDIWLTTDDLTPETIVNHTGVEYKIMPEGLGTIWGSRGNLQCVVPMYQWGRKDILGLPSAYNSNTAHTLYDINGNTVTLDTYGVADDADAGGTVRSVANSIKMPHKFFLEYDNTNYNWNNLPWFNNFWNAAETISPDLADNQMTAIKTIYDPCPVGYMLLAGRGFTGFTSTGTNSGTAGEFNVVGSFANGWKFKKNSSDATGVFYQAAGYRNGSSGNISYVGSLGYYWTFAPNTIAYAYYLYFDSYYISPLGSNNRVACLAIRPSIEY